MRRKKILLPFIAFIFSISVACSSRSEDSNTPTTDKGTLKIEAQIIYTSGGPQPAARDAFYLLDADLLDVELPKSESIKNAKSLEEAMTKFSPRQQLKFIIEVARANKMMQEYAREHRTEIPNLTPDKGETVLLGIELLKRDKENAPHFIQSVTTDFQGRASFDSLKAGDHWIMGVTETRAGFAFWNYKVTVKPGENKVLLSQENALYSK
ncbi:MAG: hypothetical protein QOF02_3805 [Blastocatellia bacterium]|jgi:hypothetical protein|nr:hypothetical protein [Blastocatellia bacterium]